MNFHIFTSYLLHLRVYYELTSKVSSSAPSLLDRSFGKSTAPVSQRSWVRIALKPDFFFFSGFFPQLLKLSDLTFVKHCTYCNLKTVYLKISSVKRFSFKKKVAKYYMLSSAKENRKEAILQTNLNLALLRQSVKQASFFAFMISHF